ncbi:MULTISPECIES: hypothetical protein [unclassified Rhodanobacter]|uniref:Uncharacterized protein n=1 Tax=Rhodanobacter humi TaxID=1888173 RepID=A0ABV4AVU2_9GAMM
MENAAIPVTGPCTTFDEGNACIAAAALMTGGHVAMNGADMRIRELP